MFREMKHFKNPICLIIMASVLVWMPALGAAKAVDKDPALNKKVANLRVPFIQNEGQLTDENVSYYAKTFGGTLFVTRDGEMIYSLPLVEKEKGDTTLPPVTDKEKVKGWVLKERLLGSLGAFPRGVDKAQTKVNYFKGNDQSKWKSNLPTFNEMDMGEVYEGIDLCLRAYGNNVEKIFTVHPGSTPEIIRLSMEGVSSLRVNEEGQLEAGTGLGPVQFTAPIAYQLKPDSAEREYIQVAYRLIHSGYGFDVGTYDRDRPLIVDPLLASTFIGGLNSDNAQAIAIDGSGNVYIAGSTSSPFYPISTGAYDTTHNGGSDVFISILNANLTTPPVASTFIGGSSTDECNSLALDSSNNVYVTGRTSSTDFPTAGDPIQGTLTGGDDVFVSALSPDLSSLIASTFIGGAANDAGYSIDIDASNNIYVTGYTQDAAAGLPDYPITGGAYNEIHNGGYDVFVSRLDSPLMTLIASTFVGGSDNDFGTAIAIDTSGTTVYITGRTVSTDYPFSAGAYQETYQGGIFDAFVTRLDSTLSTVTASTFLGGSENDQAWAIDLDSANNVYTTGYTYSDNFPTTTGPVLSGTFDAFVTRLNPDLTLSPFASTFLGAEVAAQAEAIVVDNSGTTIYVTGYTSSSGTTPFPITSGAYPPQGGNDAFVTILNSSLSISASTCLGGLDSDWGNALVVDDSGNIYVTGYTSSSNFPIKFGAYDDRQNGSNDIFVSHLTSDLTFMPPGDYYVDVNQTAEGDGSAGNPWRTLHYAISEINNGGPGDYTLHVAPGNYSSSFLGVEDDAPLNVGRIGSNIHILGDPTGNSVMEGIIDSNWIDGFSIYTSGVTIENMTITGFYQGIYVEESSPDIVKNWIYDCDDAIFIYADQEAIAPNIWNNLIYNTMENMSNGISLVASTSYGTASITSTIYHNTIHGAMMDGILLWEEGSGYGSIVEPDIRYNIITNCLGYGVNYAVDDGTPGGTPTFAYNDVYNTYTPYGGELTDQTGINGNISVDPIYVDGGSPYFDYHLQSGSPCIDVIPLSAEDPVTDDLDGNARPVNTNWDMGAYEYGAAPPVQYTLTVTIVGSGAVDLNPPGGTYDPGTDVELTAVPGAPNCIFKGWSGALTGTTNPTTLTMNSDVTVTATFNCSADIPGIDPSGTTDNEIVGEVTEVTLVASPFSDPEGDAHQWSHWLVKWAGSVYHRADYDPSFDVVSASELETHTAYGVESGLKYIWKVGYVDSGSGVTSWSREYSFIVGTPEETNMSFHAGTEQKDYCMVSFTQYPEQSAVTETIPGAGDTRNFRFGTWDSNNGGYISYGNNLFIEPGKAYWFLTRNRLNLTFNGVPVSTTHDMEVPLGYNPATENAWNMIAPPNNAYYLWDDVEVIQYNPDTGAVLFGPTPVSDPSVATYIDQRIWMWNSGAYDVYNPGESFLLAPGEGYWVRSLAPNVFLRFPVSAQQLVSLSTPRTIFATLYKQGKQWIQKGWFSPRTATADADDSPPMPMGGLNENETSGAPGCFVGAAGLPMRE